MTNRYAEGTDVAVERSRVQLERLLRKHGADQFMSAWDDESGRHVVAFRLHGRQIRLDLPVPQPDAPAFQLTATGRARTPAAVRGAYEQELRRRWRALLLIVKAKLTAVNDGISTLEREFLADVLLPGGTTIGQWMAPQLEHLYQTGSTPELPPGIQLAGRVRP